MGGDGDQAEVASGLRSSASAVQSPGLSRRAPVSGAAWRPRGVVKLHVREAELAERVAQRRLVVAETAGRPSTTLPMASMATCASRKLGGSVDRWIAASS